MNFATVPLNRATDHAGQSFHSCGRLSTAETDREASPEPPFPRKSAHARFGKAGSLDWHLSRRSAFTNSFTSSDTMRRIPTLALRKSPKTEMLPRIKAGKRLSATRPANSIATVKFCNETRIPLQAIAAPPLETNTVFTFKTLILLLPRQSSTNKGMRMRSTFLMPSYRSRTTIFSHVSGPFALFERSQFDCSVSQLIPVRAINIQRYLVHTEH